MEANANKFTFVWRKSVERYSAGSVEKSNQLYEELLNQDIIPAIERENLEELSSEELEEVVQELEETVEDFDKRIEESTDTKVRKQLRSERKTPKQYRKQFKDFVLRKHKYMQDLAILGERNSYSKTDHDATFMRMKDDYMKNGQLKAGYNLQIATESQYALAYDIFPNPTDTRTFIPFLDTIEEDFFSLPSYIVADEGYGSEQNYEDVFNNRQRTPLNTYSMYRKEKKKAYKNNPFNVSNWIFDQETDSFTCPNDKKLSLVDKNR